MRIDRYNNSKAVVAANAKINLYLDVTGKRSDGYHELETVMHSVSLCDSVTLELKGAGIAVNCSDSLVPCDKSNTAFKAAEAFLFAVGKSNIGLQIDIEKHIPTQAGLGGGSADAAAVILGLNSLLDTRLSNGEMLALGAKIGADVPFCIMGGCAYCTGIGEIITALPTLTGYVVIAKGKDGVSTKTAYEKIDALQGINLKSVYDFFDSKPDISELKPYCRNIFEEICGIDDVFHIKSVMEEHGASCACMSGSGSAVYGIFRDNAAAQKCSDRLAKLYGFSGVYSLVS